MQVLIESCKSRQQRRWLHFSQTITSMPYIISIYLYTVFKSVENTNTQTKTTTKILINVCTEHRYTN